jgi:serine/threonine protein kinase
MKKQNENSKAGILKSSMKYTEENNRIQTDHKSVKIVTPNRAGILQIMENNEPKQNPNLCGVKIFNPNEWNIKRFAIGKPLSRGKFGHVLLARERDSKYLFVLKMMFKSQLKENPKYLKNFRREIEIHARLNHPNIVKMHGWFHDEKRLYIIIEFCPEGELFSILHAQPNKRFPEWRASNYIKQMIHALQYLHSKNIIHRDIKPENILVDGDTLKLADFGWSIHTPNMKRKTFCGTMDYLPPEMIQNKEYDYNIDVWCVGVLAFELASGYAPFHSKNDKDVYSKIRKCEYRMFAHFSEDLKDFVKKILKHDPAKRMTLDEALQHPWITKYENKDSENRLDFEEDMET